MVDYVSSDKLNIDDKFPRRLRELIKDRLGLTQSDFAKNIGITAGYLSMILTGKSGPSAELIAGLCIHYNEYMSWLLTGTEVEKEEKLGNGRGKTGKAEKPRKFDILNQAEEWLTDEVEKNPKIEIWFEVEFEKAFDEFKKWKEEKEESAAAAAYYPTHKVA